MSTTEQDFTSKELENIVFETKAAYEDGSLYAWGTDDFDIGVTPFVTMYFYLVDGLDGDDEDLAYELGVLEKRVGALNKMIIEFYADFLKLMDLPVKLHWNNTPQTFGKGGSRDFLLEKAQKDLLWSHKEGCSFFIGSSSEETDGLASRWSFSALMKSPVSTYMAYSSVKIHFRWSWYLAHQAEWHAFIQKWLKRLQPEQCYSGLEVGAPIIMDGTPEHGAMEEALAQQFYGLDIDHPMVMGYHFNHRESESDDWFLGGALRPATWGLLLSPYWLNRLGKTAKQVQRDLGTLCTCTYIGEGVWLEVGDKPQLYPVDEGVPNVLVRINAYLKPILSENLQLHVYDEWDDDPNERFDFSKNVLWLRRFDEDSNWPNVAIRQKPLDNSPEPSTAIQHNVSAVWGGQPASHTGRWICPMMLSGAPNRIQYFKKGDILPDGESEKGTWVWHYLDNL